MAPRLPLCITLFLFVSLQSLFSQAQRTASVVMLSDIHFDPFHDPAKLPRLRTEPIEHWPSILNAAPSPTQAADLQALQTACGARALDTAWPLLKTSLAAAHDAEPRPAFVTLSGDLLTHDFPCRFNRLATGASPQDLSAFAAKTVAFVLGQMRQAFPRVPVFGALGNNDSGCADYRATPSDSFQTGVSGSLAAASGASPSSFTPDGDYSVSLPAPMDHARLLVLEDMFEARQFNTCAAAADRAPQKAQIDWLRAQLTAARARGEHVWVMAHIPPGIDVYTSFRRYVFQPTQLCTAEPRPFLADTSFSDALLDYADIVRLALFGHTHMDEIRLLRRSDPGASSAATDPQAPSQTAAAIPAKLVPAITPVFGNHPAFLVAAIDPHTATLKDWRTVVSPGPDGFTAPWAEAYRFSSTYHLPDFSAASAAKLADGFIDDKTGQSPDSTAFRQHFYPGDLGIYALGLAQIWPAYACAIREDRPSAVHACLCSTAPKPAP